MFCQIWEVFSHSVLECFSTSPSFSFLSCFPTTWMLDVLFSSTVPEVLFIFFQSIIFFFQIGFLSSSSLILSSLPSIRLLRLSTEFFYFGYCIYQLQSFILDCSLNSCFFAKIDFWLFLLSIIAHWVIFIVTFWDLCQIILLCATS